MKKVILIFTMLLGAYTSFGQRTEQKCQINCCVPQVLEDKIVLREQFTAEFVNGQTSTYVMRYTPSTQFVNFFTELDNYNIAQLILLGCSSNQARGIHQFLLWEINAPENTTGEDVLTTWFTPVNQTKRDEFFGLTTAPRFTFVMQPNRWYVIQHGLYYEKGSPLEQCGYHGANFAVKFSDTGNMRILNVQDVIKRSQVISKPKVPLKFN